MSTRSTGSLREARSAGSPGGNPDPRPSRGRRALPALVVLALLAVLLGRFLLAGRDAPAEPVAVRHAKADPVTQAQAAVRAHPGQPAFLTNLGLAYLARAKATADPTYYTKAAQALEAAYRQDPTDLRGMVGVALLDNSRHRFRAALALGERAARAYPYSADALGVVVDSQVELGRYADANATAQRMVDLKPTIASYSRISYLRELQGDPAGAIEAMTSALTAGSGSADDIAYLQTLVGDLQRGQGNLREATTAYDAALQSVPAYGGAELGLARVAAARGDLRGAARRVAPLVQRLPFPETVAFYGDVLAAAGDRAAAQQQYALVRQIERLQAASGVVVDYESARFEADHARDPGGNPARAVRLARAAYAARPTVYGADAMAWALRQDHRAREALPWADRALRLGTKDANLWWHRAAIEADLGQTAAAAHDLTTALRIDPRPSVHDGPAITALAHRLGVHVPAVRS